MKKHLSLILSALLLFTSSMTAAAFTPETVESAAEIAKTLPASEAKALEDEIDIPLLDAEYGKLIFYQNFDSEGATKDTVDYSDANYLTVSYMNPSGNTLSVVTDPADETNKVLKLTCANGSWHQYVVGMNLPLKEGRYYAVYRHASENGDVGAYMQRWFTSPNPVNANGTAKDDLISKNPSVTDLNANPGKWYETVVTGTCKIVDGVLKFGFDENNLFPKAGTEPMQKIREFRIIPNKGNLLVDDLRIYYFPASAFTVSDGSSFKMIETTEETYTFPTPDGVYFFADKNDLSKTYLAGETANISELAGGAFIPFRIPLYADGKGELVLYQDYEEGSDLKLTYSNPAYSNVTAFKKYRSDGTQSISLVADPTDETGTNHALRVYSANTSTFRLAVPEFDDMSILNSAYTVDSRYMLVDPTNFNAIYFRFSNFGAGDHTTSRSVSLANNPPAELTWTKLSLTPGDLTKMDKGIRSFGYQMNMKVGKETTYYIDDLALYAYPQNSIMFKPSAYSTEVTMLREEDLNAEGLTYTFQTPEELGYTVSEDSTFFGWMSSDGKQMYQPGDTVSYSELNHQSFYPFVQSANDNAMGYAFGGELSMTGADNQSIRYKEAIEDDGRDVLHIRTYKSFNKDLQGGKWATDSRVGMKLAEADGYNGAEFPIITYTYKIENAYKVPDEYVKDPSYDPETETFADAQPIALDQTKFVFWYYKKSATSGNIWIANNGENKLGNTYQNATADGKYHTLTLNMKNLASNSADPFLLGKTYGFGLDPVSEASWSADIYVDSIRAYRFGFTTVTYDTNAPDGASVVKEIAADTDRGLGKGYLLSDDRPEVEGYTFMGWALKPDAKASETVEAIDLTADTTVYAVWESAEKTASPVMTAASSVYLSTDKAKSGLRFRADVKGATVAYENLREYGFIVARQDMLDKYLSTLTHNFYTSDDAKKPLYVEGKAFERDEEGNVVKNYIYSTTEDGDVTFVARCVGLDITNKTQVTAALTARPYLRYTLGNGNAVTLYGSTHTASLYSVVKSIKDKADAGDEAAAADYKAHKDYIDSILALGE